MKQNSKRIVLLGVLLALALALHVVERQLPLPILPVPGVKLGLANVVSLTGICLLPLPELVLLICLRTLLSSAFGGSLSEFMFSLTGGLLSLLTMYLLARYLSRWLSLPAISVVGAIVHNLGQLLVAAMIVDTFGVLFYLPLLLLAAGLTGLLVGFTSLLLLRALSHAKLVRVLPPMQALINRQESR